MRSRARSGPIREVWDVHTPKDPNSGVRKNFAFVTFAEVDSFERAVAMGGLEVKGQQVEIKPASKDGGKGKGKGDWGFDAWGWDGGKGWGGDFGAWGKGGGWGKAGAKSGAPALPAPEGMTYYVTNLPDPCQEPADVPPDSPGSPVAIVFLCTCAFGSPSMYSCRLAIGSPA